MLTATAIFAVVSLHAQTGINKKKLIGTWETTAFEMKDLMRYDFVKDSITLSEKFKQSVDASRRQSAITMFRYQIKETYAKMRFIFNADGTGETRMGFESKPVPLTYQVDEQASTVTTTEKSRDDQPGKKPRYPSITFKAELKGESLQLTVLLDQPGQATITTLKKIKE